MSKLLLFPSISTIPQLKRCGLIEAQGEGLLFHVRLRIPQLKRCGLIEAEVEPEQVYVEN